MRYMLMFYETDTVMAERSHPEKAAAYWGGWNAYVGALAASGIVVHGEGLQTPDLATTVRVEAGQRHVQDGPFADSKEQLGGFFVVEVAHLDVALDWAAKSPAASGGRVEVRPVLPPPAR
jgi:hypothetical protein